VYDALSGEREDGTLALVLSNHGSRALLLLGKYLGGLLKLLEDKKIWVKVSGAERVSRDGTPYADAVPYGRKLVETFSDRVLWGTDWPHPNLKEIPDDGILVDLISQMAPTEAQQKALLVDNPQRFYGFKP